MRLLYVLLLCSFPALADQPILGKITQPWLLKNNTDYCSIENKFSNGLKLILTRSGSGDYQAGIEVPKGGLPMGGGYTLSLSFDDHITKVYEAKAVANDLLSLDLGIMKALPPIQVLTIQGPKDQAIFVLQDLPHALTQLETCAAKLTDTTPSPAAQNNLPNDLAQLLKKAGLKDVITLPTTDLSNIDYAWKSEDIYGGSFDEQAPGNNIEQVMMRYLVTTRQKCQGETVSILDPLEEIYALKMRSGHLMCMADTRQSYIGFVFYQSALNTYRVIFHETDQAHEDQLKQIQSDLKGAIKAQLVQ